MFLTHPQQTKDNFIENIKNLLDDCLNSRNKINPHQLPKTLLAGDAAWLIVCAQHQETVILDNDETFKNIAKEAVRIHRRIQSRYYQEFKGIEQVDIALDFEGTAHLNFTLTKEAFLEYLNSNDKYRQLLLANAHISSGTTPENPTQQIFVQMIQNNVDLTLSKTEISNIDARIFNTEVSLDKNPSQVEKQPMSPDDPDTIIDTVLKTDITTLIRKTFPHYSGHIQNKTSAPHRLVIKVMIIMLKLNYKDLTWSTVKGFIEDYISGNYDRQILANLEEITDDYITVSNVRLDKTNATKKVGEYKSLFNIKSV